jgi:DNA polymerase-3 subunit gamma/tau
VSAGPSLYRRHRPRTFADVVGQEHVVRTLRNAVEQGKVHHAYLFVGSRGTGKTSMAKMLAACMNCVNGPTTEPCGTCESCVAIANATSLDVIEMDAASNNSVDDIRELRESVAYAPVSGRSKVYILDEAHMLSSQAWNAFLKTLEEPPPHTIFVLATTEANKVLPTVVDRCHRFDFQRPSVEQIATVVSRVAGKESIDIPPEAIVLLARQATGSFRDALGTLEQLVTYSGTDVRTEDVLAVLGVADADLLFSAIDAVAAHDARGALQAAARLADSGRDLARFVKDLETHARELLVVRTLGEVPAELRITPDRDERLAEQAERVPAGDVVRLLDLLAGVLRAVKDGADARTQLELALVKAAAPEVDPSARALMARIERLEAALQGGSAPAPTAAAAPAPSSARASAPPAPAAPQAAPQAPQAVAAVAVAGSEPARATATVALAELTIDAFQGVWPAVLEAVRAENQLLGALLSEARPLELRDGEVVIAFSEHEAFKRKMADGRQNRTVLEEAIRSLAGSGLRVCLELRPTEEVAPGAVAAPPPSEDELVARFVAEFDAEEIVPEPDVSNEEGGA